MYSCSQGYCSKYDISLNKLNLAMEETFLIQTVYKRTKFLLQNVFFSSGFQFSQCKLKLFFLKCSMLNPVVPVNSAKTFFSLLGLSQFLQVLLRYFFYNFKQVLGKSSLLKENSIFLLNQSLTASQ